MLTRQLARLLAVFVCSAIVSSAVRADEGMWTFDNFPSDRVKTAYGFAPDQAWLDHVRLASVRLATGCSAALVSGHGLVQTNHHCVLECVQNFSRPGENLVDLGFKAVRPEDEKKCQGYTAEVLTAITDVTARVTTATAQASPETFARVRDAEISRIEGACQAGASDRRCEVVELYQGGQYKLYDYRRYTDLRLVFAPEIGAAFFGGDPDNFNFPRYCFDAAYLRIYDGDKPLATPDHLKWRSEPLKDGEPAFVSGNPGSTQRLFTTAQLAFQRDHVLPWELIRLSEMRGRLITYSALGDEQKRIAADALFGVENSFKALSGRRSALVDPAVFGAQVKAEADLKAKVAADPKLAAEVGDAWGEIAKAQADYESFFFAHQYLESRAGGGSDLFAYARALVRAAEERQKPDAERLPPYTEARLPSLQRTLFAENPIEAPLQEMQLSFWLSKLREYLTTDDPLTKKILGKESPEALAARLVKGTKLADPAERRRLYEGGAKAIAESDDPLILFAKSFDADARALRKRYDEEVDGPITRAQKRIARARFAAYGDSVYPDATFTLRLSYGSVQGWTEPSGRKVGPFTHIGGLFERATGSPPFALVPSWEAARDKVNHDTIFNVTTNNDIIGGNSGSPLIDKEGRVAGAIFDGNIHSLGGEYAFDPAMNRAIAVAATAIEEGLSKVYGMDRIVRELKE
jgi:hypothetical protein